MNLSVVLYVLLFVSAGVISSLVAWLIFRKLLWDEDWQLDTVVTWAILLGISVIGTARLINYELPSKVAVPIAAIPSMLLLFFLLKYNPRFGRTKSG